MSARTPQGSPRAASRHSLACILPPDLLIELARGADAAHRDSLLSTLAIDQGLRVARAEIAARTLQQPHGGWAHDGGGCPHPQNLRPGTFQ